MVPADPALLRKKWRLLKVRATRQIDVAPELVWAAISDHATWTEWHADYDAHEPVGAKTVGLGARFKTKEWVVDSESEITRWVPGEAVGMSIVESKVWRWLMRSYYSEVSIEPVESEPNRSVVHYGAAFTGTLAFWLLSAYSVGYSLGSIYWDARSSLKGLEAFLGAAGDADAC